MERSAIERLRELEGRLARLEQRVSKRSKRAAVWFVVLIFGGVALGRWLWTEIFK